MCWLQGLRLRCTFWLVGFYLGWLLTLFQPWYIKKSSLLIAQHNSKVRIYKQIQKLSKYAFPRLERRIPPSILSGKPASFPCSQRSAELTIAKFEYLRKSWITAFSFWSSNNVEMKSSMGKVHSQRSLARINSISLFSLFQARFPLLVAFLEVLKP